MLLGRYLVSSPQSFPPRLKVEDGSLNSHLPRVSFRPQLLHDVHCASVGIRTGLWSRNVGGVFELERKDLRAELFRDINRKRISGAPT
jgi:hypothetical protein